MSERVSTGVMATDEEINELQELIDEARANTQISFMGNGMLREKTDMSAVLARCHEMALAHGLPPIDGRYGIRDTGEFILLPRRWTPPDHGIYR